MQKSLALALLALCLSTAAWSQQPGPVQAPSTQSTQSTQALEPEQRGTDKAPLTVKILPAPDAKEQTEKEERERHEKAAIDQRLADDTNRLANDTGQLATETNRLVVYTGILAAFTAALFFAAAFQVGLFWIQLRYLRDSAVDTRNAAQAALMQAETARAEFSATHRPELILRAVSWEMVDMDGGRIVNDEIVTFLLVNRGRNLCTIVESAIALRMTPLPAWAAANGENQLGAIRLAPGEFQPVRHELTEDEMFVVGARVMNDCYFSGIIIYADDTGARRRHVFNRICQKGGDEFTRTDNPEDEYTD